MQNKVKNKQFWLNVLIVVLDIVAVNVSYYIALYARFIRENKNTIQRLQTRADYRLISCA